MYEEIKNKLEDFYGIACPDFFVEICNSRKEFENKIGKENTPNWLVGFCKENRIYIFSAEALEKESNHKKEELEQILTHEICHIFNRQIKKDIIKWIDEGVACFVADQHKKPDFNKGDLINFFNNQFNPDNGYRISYWAIKTIYKIGGKDKILELLKTDSQNIENILDIAKGEFINKMIQLWKQ